MRRHYTMSDNNNLLHTLGSTLVQKVIFGIATLILTFAGFMAKLEYNNIDERIDNNATAITKVEEHVNHARSEAMMTKSEQIRRGEVLSRIEANIKWLWGESDKVKAENKALYELIHKSVKAVEDDARQVREAQIKGYSRVEKTEDRLTRLEVMIGSIEQRLRLLEERPPTYRSDKQQREMK